MMMMTIIVPLLTDPTLMSSLRVLKDKLKNVTTMAEQLRKDM